MVLVRKIPASLFLLTLLLGASLRPSSGSPELPVEDLPASASAHMSMTYQKGFLFIQVDVMKLDVRIGGDPGERILALALPDRIDDAVADSIAALAIGSRDALVAVTFLRDIDLDRFIKEAAKATKRVWERGAISKEEYERVRRNLPAWYKSLKERGIRKGDRMFYRIQEDRLHTVFQGEDGHRFVDQVDEGPEPRRAVIGGYFVEGSDFRSPLIKSLLKRAEGE